MRRKTLANESKVKRSRVEDSNIKTRASDDEVPDEASILNSIQSLQEASEQISALTEKEKNYSTEMTEKLEEMIASFNATYHLDPAAVLKDGSSVSDVAVTSKGEVCLTYNSGRVTSRPLESLTSDALISILSRVIPDLKVRMNERKEKLQKSGRVVMLEKISEEINKVGTIDMRRK